MPFRAPSVFQERPTWQENYAVGEAITQCLNDQVKGLGKEVTVKNGRYNQHISPNCILIEVGNNKNTLQEALAAMPYLANAIAKYLENSESYFIIYDKYI